MRPLAKIALTSAFTGLVALTTHVAVLFPPLPDMSEGPRMASAETSTPVSPMGPDYIAPPPYIPVS